MSFHLTAFSVTSNRHTWVVKVFTTTATTEAATAEIAKTATTTYVIVNTTPATGKVASDIEISPAAKGLADIRWFARV